MKNPSFIAKMIIIRRWFKEYKAQCRCSACGTEHNIEFHHLRDKKMKISQMVRKCVSIEQLKEEIQKCIPLCHQCHKAEHQRLKDGNQKIHRAF